LSVVNQRRIGPWTLQDLLGRGGNASVWSATRSSDESPAALKIINTFKVQREPYQRFVREITFLRNHQADAGLLPLLDAYLPDDPAQGDQPWLAMPIATPIRAALAGRPLTDVVAAVARISETLWHLQRDFRIAHRDIKPGNLYELDGAWLIGDFGLVALPDTEGLTAAGHALGPAHYTAYEMILDPTLADPHAADVYSLGKTLWVLATDQAFPPEGYQPVGTRGFEVGDFRPHARSGALDQEIELMTRLHPEERPSMEQVARDLASWQLLATEPVMLDLSVARSRLRHKLEAQIAEQHAQDQRKDLALAAVRHLQKLTSPLNEALKSLSARTQIDSATDKMTVNTVKSLVRGVPQVVFRWQRCTLVAPLDHPASATLRMGRSLELVDDGALLLNLMVHVGPEGVMHTDFYWRSEVMSAPVGSVQAENMLDQGVQDLAEAIQRGVQVFVELFPNVGSAR